MKLYELTSDFVNLFERLDELSEWSPEANENGEPIDENGNIIEDVELYKEKLIAAWFDILDGMEYDFKAKAVNIAACIKSIKAEAEALHSEERRLEARRQVKENQLESLKSYILNNMKAVGLSKIDEPMAKLSIRNNAESVVVDDEKAFIKWALENDDGLLKYADPKIKKTSVKILLQSGAELPCVHLTRTQSLIIK